MANPKRFPNHRRNGFTLIELLVVISIIGILAGIMISSGLFSFLSDAEAKKTKSIFRAWVTQIYQYKETYKHFPPVLLQKKEGEPLEIGEEFEEEHDRFIAALKGREVERSGDSAITWSELDSYRDENKRSREFHSFGEDEFGDNGYLADAWGGDRIYMVVDRNGDGLIELDESAFNDIKDALLREYDSEIIDAAGDNLKVIHEKVGIYVLNDGGDGKCVFSWNIEKYLDD
jgi:prepilin-type N-terminal cleavage/methylation domain-containing protein